MQKIPPFSARKYRGKPLYQYARQGIPIPEMMKQVEIHFIELLHCEEGEFGSAELRISCTSGTYIRSLAHELGVEVGLGAYLFALCRERVGNFSLTESIDVFQPDVSAEWLRQKSLPIDQALDWIPSLFIDGEGAKKFRQGNALTVYQSFFQGWVKVYNRDVFLGLGEMTNSGILHPKIVVG